MAAVQLTDRSSSGTIGQPEKPTAQAAAAGPPPGWLARLSAAVAQPLESFFERSGRSVALHPYRAIAAVLAVAAACSAGFTRWTPESRPEELWVPSSAAALGHRAYVEANYEKDPRFNALILEPAEQGGSLTRQGVLDAFDVHDRVLAVEARVTGKFASDFPGVWTYERLCERRGGLCNQRTLLDYFSYNRSLVPATDQGVLDAVNDPARRVTALGDPLPLGDVAGGVTTDPATGNVTGAEALRFVMYAQNNEVFDGGEDVDPPGEAWEAALISDVVLPDRRVLGFNVWAQSDEFSKAIRADIGLFAFGYLLIIAYMALALGRAHRVHAKVALTLGAVLTVGLAITAAYGLSSALGVIYGPVHSVLPFLLLGLGVDDGFIIVHSFLATYREHPAGAAGQLSLPDRVASAMRHAGVSITVTSFTDMVAFLVGSSTALPALSSFCIYAALGILALWAFTSTAFVAFLTLDARRADQNRLDCLCCVTSKRPPAPVLAPPPPAGAASAGACAGPDRVRRALAAGVRPLVENRAASVAVVAFFAVLAAFGAVGASKLEQEFSFENFVPSDSYLQPFFDADEALFSSGARVMAVARDADFFAEQARLSQLHAEVMRGSSYLDPAAASSWYESYLEWLPSSATYPGGAVDADGRPTNETGFYVSAHEFVTATPEGARFGRDVVFRDAARPEAGIVTCRVFGAFLEERTDTSKEQVRAMDGLRSEVAAVPGLNGFPYATDFLFWEQYKVITGEMVRNILLSLAAVLVITTVLLASPAASFLVFVCVALTIVDLLGLMWAWDLNIDAVATVNLVLSTGLSVDYSAHVALCFLQRSGTPSERAVTALADIGGSVLNGAISTFLAVLVLAFSKSYIFKVFFRMFFGTILFGVAHGMVLLPVLLTLVAPPAYAAPPQQAGTAGAGGGKAGAAWVEPEAGAEAEPEAGAPQGTA